MKYLIVIFLTLLFFGFNIQSSIGQNAETYKSLQKHEEKFQSYIQFTDPAFPVLKADGTNLGEFKIALEQYAKLHPPIQDPVKTGDPAADEVKNKILRDNWYAENTYFPRFIPYHLYHKNLSEADDIRFYENAVRVWREKNSDQLFKNDNE